MRFTSIVAAICVFAAGAANAAADRAATAPPAGRAGDAQPSSSPDYDKVIAIFGFVRKEGAIQPTVGLTVSRAIEIAGGFSDFANRRKVVVRRRKENRSFTVDVKAVLENTPGAQDPLLEPGDSVYVPTRLAR